MNVKFYQYMLDQVDESDYLGIRNRIKLERRSSKPLEKTQISNFSWENKRMVTTDIKLTISIWNIIHRLHKMATKRKDRSLQVWVRKYTPEVTVK